MEKVHEVLMMDVLRDVYQFGSARLPYHLMYRWFRAEKIGKRTWLRIIDMWDEVREEHGDEEGWRIGFIDTGRSDDLTLVCLDPEGARESYMKPLIAKTT